MKSGVLGIWLLLGLIVLEFMIVIRAPDYVNYTSDLIEALHPFPTFVHLTSHVDDVEAQTKNQKKCTMKFRTWLEKAKISYFL